MLARRTFAFAVPPSLLVAVALAAGCLAPPYATIRDADLRTGARGVGLTQPVTRHVLANGLTVIMAPETDSNLVEVSVRYEVGAAEDPQGKSGLAHLVEHLTFVLSPERPTLSDRLAATALTYNAYTNWDETHYTATAFRENLVELLEVEAARMRGDCTRLDEPLLARERDVVKNELRERFGLWSAADRLLQRQVYGNNHAYSRPVGGTEAELDHVTPADVCGFLGDYYAPERATLVITGRFDSAATRLTLDDVFQSVPARRPKPRASIEPIALTGSSSKHTLPVRRATALIAVPGSVFADREASYDFLLRRLLEQELWLAARKDPHLVEAELTQRGGRRAPIDIAVVTADDPDHLQDAVDAFFRVRDRLRDELSFGVVQSQRARAAALLIDLLTDPTSRSDTLADFYQYGGVDEDLSIVAKAHTLFFTSRAQLRERATAFFARDSAHVALIYPAKEGPATNDQLEVRQVARTYDVGAWRAPVDPTDANRPLALPDQGAPHIDVHTFELDNGLRVIMVPSLRYPLVDIRLVLPVGSSHEPADQPGLARATAEWLDHDYDLTYQGRDRYVVSSVLSMGGRMTTSVGEKTTTFRATGLSTFADGLIWELSWLLEYGIYRSSDLSRARKRARELERARDDRDTEQERRTRTILQALFGKDHPYATASSPIARLDKLTTGKLQAFREEHYRARGAALVVVGSFDAEDMEKRIRRLFGFLSGSKPPAALREIPPADRGERARHFAEEDEDTSQIHIWLAFLTPPDSTPAERAAQSVLVEMLRLRLSSLRERFGATYGIHVDHIRLSAAGVLMIAGDIDASRGAQTMAAMKGILDELRAGEGLEEDFVRARRAVVRRWLAHTSDPASVAGALSRIALGLAPRDDRSRRARDIAGVRLADVRAQIEQRLRAEHEVAVVSGPATAVKAAYDAAGVTDFEVVE